MMLFPISVSLPLSISLAIATDSYHHRHRLHTAHTRHTLCTHWQNDVAFSIFAQTHNETQ